MYYDNKRSFYIKQYGPAVLILTLSVILIGSGIFIYLSSTKSKAPQNELIVASDNLKDEEKVDSNKKAEINVSNSILPNSLLTLKTLEKSNEVIVKSASSGKVIVTVDNKDIELTLIGIDIKNAMPDLNDKMQQDLQGKKIKIAFDNEKSKNENFYAYIYLDDTLYNATLLENGIIKLKTDDTNNSLQNDLTQAQTFAKQTLAGVWSKE
ncbi:MAG: thermonuclease family protein [Clostridia bacterium]